MTPGVTPELLDLVPTWEAVRLTAYPDPLGLPTQGIGHRVASLNVPPITRIQAFAWLAEDLAAAAAEAVRLSPVLRTETPRRWAAITDFCFNAGSGRYAAANCHLRLNVNLKHWAQAAFFMRQWVHGHDEHGNLVTLPGLVTRRNITASWLEQG